MQTHVEGGGPWGGARGITMERVRPRTDRHADQGVAVRPQVRSVPKPRPPAHPAYCHPGRERTPGAETSERARFTARSSQPRARAKGSWRQLGGREADGVGVRVSRAAGGQAGRRGGTRRGGTQRRWPADPRGGARGAAPGVQPARKRAGGSPGAQSARSRREGRRYARRGQRVGKHALCGGTGPKAARVPSAPCTALRCPPRCELLGRKDCSPQGPGVGRSSSDPVSPLTLASLTPLGAIGHPLPGTPPRPRGR